MALTYFLAQLIGVYFLLIGLLMLVRKNTFLQVVYEFYDHPVSLFLAGWMAMFFGLLLVLSYNYWNAGTLELIITLTGWAALLKGLALLFIPSVTSRWVRSMNLERFSSLYAVIVLVLGTYLAHAGFTHTGILH